MFNQKKLLWVTLCLFGLFFTKIDVLAQDLDSDESLVGEEFEDFDLEVEDSQQPNARRSRPDEIENEDLFGESDIFDESVEDESVIKNDQILEQYQFEETKVLVEGSQVLTSRDGDDLSLVPYRIRRKKWGGSFSVSYSNYEPSDYESSQIALGFEEVYFNPDTPLIDLTFVFKRNISLGSIGLEVGVGIYENYSDLDNIETNLRLIPIRFGGTVILDTLFSEPYVAPYVSGGGYTILFKESLAGNSFNGNTQVAPYVAGGIMLQLDWLDPNSARQGYVDAEIQNSFLYIEARQLYESVEASDPDFSSAFHYAAGVRVEL